MSRTGSDERFVRASKALGHPLRARILDLLSEREECIVGELAGHFGVAQSTMSEHLRILKEAGLVQGSIEGPTTCYCLDPQTLAWYADEVQRRFGVRPAGKRGRRLPMAN